MQILRNIIVFLCLPAAAVANDLEVISQPPQYKVGDSWTYLRTDKLKLDVSRPRQLQYTSTITDIGSDGIVIRRGRVGGTPDGPPRLYTPELNLIQEGKTRYTPFIAFRRFPLSVGKSWHERYDFITAAGNRMHSQTLGKVEGWESVTVPAGTFRCLKIVVKTYGSAVGAVGAYGTDSLRTECWSPEVRSFIRMEFYIRWVTNPQYHDLLELVAFKISD
jgi:hypothetical protein